MKMKLAMAGLLVLTLFLDFRQWERTNRLQNQLDEVKKVVLSKPIVQHKYRFERDGASLWRYDEGTGEACQLQSNMIDKWIGGHCPPLTPEGPVDQFGGHFTPAPVN